MIFQEGSGPPVTPLDLGMYNYTKTKVLIRLCQLTHMLIYVFDVNMHSIKPDFLMRRPLAFFLPFMILMPYKCCELTSTGWSTSLHSHAIKNSKWVWSGNTTITNCRQPRGTARKSCSTITRHQEDKLSKAISSLFPIKMIAILEWTSSNVQQNIEQLQTPTMGVTINKKSITTEPPP